jgi:hypothetical protein
MPVIEWEDVKQQTTDGTNIGGYMYRAKVPNGWLIKEVHDTGYYDSTGRLIDGYHWTSTITFVPDFEHLWVV